MGNLVILDTETGGLDPEKVSILSVGVVVVDENLVELGQKEIFVKEDDIVAEEQALKVNKIDLNWLKVTGKNPFNAVLELEFFLSGFFDCAKESSIPLAGHNIGFDIGFMKRLYRLAGKNFEQTFSHRTMDTASVLRFLKLAGVTQTEASSNQAFAHYKIVVAEEKRHTALGDALATAELLRKLVAEVKHG
jgi:DNA polymerase-3 subunit epsilon